jgi:uncharacterized protein YacL
MLLIRPVNLSNYFHNNLAKTLLKLFDSIWRKKKRKKKKKKKKEEAHKSNLDEHSSIFDGRFDDLFNNTRNKI